MLDIAARHAIEDDLGGCRGEDDADPLDEFLPEAQVLHDSDQERPGHRVECLRDVDLEEHGGGAAYMQRSSCKLDHLEIVMYRSPLDKSRLVFRDQRRQPWGKTASKQLGEQLAKTVSQTDRPEVLDFNSVRLLRKQRDQRL